ncbi:MAG: cation transporter [Dinoroseobacter sp.]|nr:cation transporter [Dinoroseobacter sp.]
MPERDPDSAGAQPAKATALQEELRALTASAYGTLFMGIAGVVAAALSNSQAILLDGLFSFVGFIAALFARQVTRRVQMAPDRLQPLGHGAEESIFTTFRALSLLGVVLFAILNAASSILAYVTGQPPTPLNMGPIAVYLGVILFTCVALWGFHRRAWIKGGRQSDILKLEANAAAFDGAVTAAAGAGLFLVSALKEGPLAVLAPIGDSLIVLVLCGFASVRYFSDFRAGLAELAGLRAPTASYVSIRRAIRAPLDSFGARLLDISVLKTGRTYSAIVFVDPERPVSPAEIDTLNRALERAAREQVSNAYLLTVVTANAQRSNTLSGG